MPTLITTVFVSGLGAASLLAVSPGSVVPQVHGGHHVVTDGSDRVVIQTQWLCLHRCTLPLALPLPPEATLDGVTEQRSDDGSIVGVVSSDSDVTFNVSVPLATVQALGSIPLALPDRAGTHRITFDSGLAFEPDVGLGLAPRFTVATTKGVHRNPRRWLDADLNTVEAGRGVVRYATQADVVRTGGFTGQLERAETRRRRLLLIAGAMFVLVVAAMAAAHRRLMRRADEERVDKLLAEEIEALDSSR